MLPESCQMACTPRETSSKGQGRGITAALAQLMAQRFTLWPVGLAATLCLDAEGAAAQRQSTCTGLAASSGPGLQLVMLHRKTVHTLRIFSLGLAGVSTEVLTLRFQTADPSASRMVAGLLVSLSSNGS